MLLCSVHAWAVAQSAAARRDSLAALRVSIAEAEQRIHLADSAGDARTAARERIMLAPLCKRQQAIALLTEAAHIADTAKLFEGEEMHARQDLVELYRFMGNWKMAFAEAERLIVLQDASCEMKAKELVDLERGECRRALAQRDSTEEVLAQEHASTSAALTKAKRRGDHWFMMALGFTGIMILALVFVLWRNTKHQQRTLAEINMLREEITVLKVPSGNRYREAAPAIVDPPTALHPAVAPIPVPSTVIDEKALAFFGRMAPERLSALHNARSLGDQEKIMRVVHTLKPHLMALDPDGLGALCERIKGMDAMLDPAELNAALDELVSGVEALLK